MFAMRANFCLRLCEQWTSFAENLLKKKPANAELDQICWCWFAGQRMNKIHIVIELHANCSH